ncbi:MAG: H-NS histone family protein [Rhizobacter sp.]|jgi:DNA-binding protein H-NS|nr:H-NS histone family protein [Rhizobacter sp.]MBP6268316.1 H-NS histone family protein [Rhizobacter sp.]HOX67897.1 H-NS histone family protein [Burkholderiaceae bacterium]
MSTLKELLDRKAALDKEIESTRKQEHANAIEKVRALMQEYGLTISDISNKAPVRAASSTKGGKVAAKYRNKATGETWSGRGLQPKWLKAALSAGHQLSEFTV